MAHALVQIARVANRPHAPATCARRQLRISADFRARLEAYKRLRAEDEAAFDAYEEAMAADGDAAGRRGVWLSVHDRLVLAEHDVAFMLLFELREDQ